MRSLRVLAPASVLCLLAGSALAAPTPADVEPASPAVAASPASANTSTVAPSGPPPREPPLDLSDHAIQKAIADSKELMDGLGSTPRSGFGSGGGPVGQALIDRAFREAEIPSCLTPDAFRFDPPALGPITFTGFAALPFWAQAITSGGCRF